MYRFKRILAVFISVCLLSVTVGSTYFDTMHIEKVEALELTAGAGVTAATLFQLCLFIGAVWGTYYLVGEVVNNQEEIARAGKNFIDSVKDIPDGWLFSITDATTGQDYVFGSEALELIQDTSWEVIQGGGGHNRGDDDEDDDEKEGFINLFRSSSEYVGNFLALGATWFMSHASDLYQKWVNGEEMTEAELAAIEPLIAGYCNQDDIASQWSGLSFNYSANVKYSYMGDDGKNIYVIIDSNKMHTMPSCGYLIPTSNNGYSLKLQTIDEKGIIYAFSMPGTSYSSYTEKTISINSSSVMAYPNSKYPNVFSFSYALNFPVFSSQIDADNYLKGIGDVTNALNYAKIYKNADWLSDDWQGLLIDPLTNIGLTLSQLIELMKALGLNAVGNNLSPEDIADLIKKSLPSVNPDLLPDDTPVIVPDAPGDPIYYPSPDAHPTPSPIPDTGSDPDPEPDYGDTPDEIIDVNDIVSDTSSNFSDISGTLKRKFPFSLPWDIHYLLTVLADTPKTPVYYLPLVIERLGINEVVVVDMSDFEDISKLSRAMLSLLYAYGLMNWTVKIVSVRKEE